MPNLDYWTYYDIQKELAELYKRKGDNPNALLHYIGNAYYACCGTANLIHSQIIISTEQVNPIYLLKAYFSDNMIDFCNRLPVPTDKSVARYNINYFKKQIYSIIR